MHNVPNSPREWAACRSDASHCLRVELWQGPFVYQLGETAGNLNLTDVVYIELYPFGIAFAVTYAAIRSLPCVCWSDISSVSCPKFSCLYPWLGLPRWWVVEVMGLQVAVLMRSDVQRVLAHVGWAVMLKSMKYSQSYRTLIKSWATDVDKNDCRNGSLLFSHAMMSNTRQRDTCCIRLPIENLLHLIGLL